MNSDERLKIKEKHYADNCSHDNSDLRIEEVERAIEALSGYSAPNPEEQIFNIMLKKGGEAVAKGLHYIFQKSWSLAVLPGAFIQDAKVMLPKPGKTDYNTVRPSLINSLFAVTRPMVLGLGRSVGFFFFFFFGQN